MKSLLFTLMAFSIFILDASAQFGRQLQERTSISFGTQVGVPQSEFRDVYGDLSYGIGGSFVTKNKFPFLYTGINYTYARMGKFTEQVSLQSGTDFSGSPVFEEANASLSNKVHRGHIVARLEPFRGRVQPYIEGMAGGVIYNTALKVEKVSDFDSEVSKENLETSVAGSAGWAVGLKFQLMRGLFVEGRMENLLGSNARYVDPESVFMDINENFQYDILQSQTNSKIFHLGISLDF